MINKRLIFRSLKYSLIEDLAADNLASDLLGQSTSSKLGSNSEALRVFPLTQDLCHSCDGVRHVVCLFVYSFEERFGETRSGDKSHLVVYDNTAFARAFGGMGGEWKKYAAQFTTAEFRFHAIHLDSSLLPEKWVQEIQKPEKRQKVLANVFESALEGLAHEIHYIEQHCELSSPEHPYPNPGDFTDPIRDADYDLLCSFESIGQVLAEIENREIQCGTGANLLQTFLVEREETELERRYYQMWRKRFVTEKLAQNRLQAFAYRYQEGIPRMLNSKIDIDAIRNQDI